MTIDLSGFFYEAVSCQFELTFPFDVQVEVDVSHFLKVHKIFKNFRMLQPKKKILELNLAYPNAVLKSVYLLSIL